MRTLYESLLDDFDDLDKDVQQNAKKSVMKFLTDNYILNDKPINPRSTKIKISKKPNKDGKYVVDVNGNIDVKNYDMYTLTNNIFVFGKVKGFFYCSNCKNLTSLDGVPEKIGTSFYCSACDNLTSLKGAPEEVGSSFCCSKCENLTSLKGSPKKVGSFHCGYTNITSLKGAPEKVGGSFDCANCNKLKNLDYLPKEIRGVSYIPDHLQK